MKKEIHTIVWQDITIEITYTPEWGSVIISDEILAHVAIRSIKPECAKLPMTETGYRSHFTGQSFINEFATVTDFVKAWLDTEAEQPAWQDHIEKQRQYALF